MVALALLSGVDEMLHAWFGSLGWQAEGVVRLLLAVAAGGLVGLERETRNRVAGFRTLILVCLGSALVMIISTRLAYVDWPGQTQGENRVTIDPGRIAYGIMTGIGFLGAGTIIERRGRAKGLTTAAAIWCVAAIGMALGFGLYVLGLATTLLVLAALWLLDYVEGWIPSRRTRVLTLRVRYQPTALRDIVERFNAVDARVERAEWSRVAADDTWVDITLNLTFPSGIDHLALEARLAEQLGFDIRSSQAR